MARKLDCRAIIFWPNPINNLEDFYGEGYHAKNFVDLCATYSANSHNDLWIVDEDPGKSLDAASLTDDPYLVETNAKGIDADRIFDRGSQVLYNGYKMLRLKDEPTATVRGEIPVLLNSLIPSYPIRNAYQKLLSTHNPSEFIAVHYRRGDLGEYLRRATSNLNGAPTNGARIRRQTDLWFRKCAPLSTYFSFIENNVKRRQKIALFSDEKEIPAKFEDRFGQKKIYCANKFAPELLDIQSVYLEMLFMSRCRSIVSSKSGFSELPSIMGGVRVTNIQRYCSLVELADDYLTSIELDRSRTLPEKILEIFGQSGESHYRRVLKSEWSEHDFRNALSASWERMRAAS